MTKVDHVPDLTHLYHYIQQDVTQLYLPWLGKIHKSLHAFTRTYVGYMTKVDHVPDLTHLYHYIQQDVTQLYLPWLWEDP